MSILRFCPHIQVSIFRFYRTFYFTKILIVRESFTRINCLNNDLTFTICNTYVGVKLYQIPQVTGVSTTNKS